MLRTPALFSRGGSGVATASEPAAQTTALNLRRPGEHARDWLAPGSDETFRGIYTRAGMGSSRVLAISSAITGEGKTTIAVGLGVTVAQDFPERQVLVVEANLQSPVLAQDFDLEPGPGLVDCLLNDEPIHTAYRPTFLENLHILPAGEPVENTGRILRSNRMVAAVDAMSRSYDLVILDVPAILANSDGLLLTDLADGVLFVVRAGVTPLHLVNKAIAQLGEGKMRGVVLNGAQSSTPGWLRRLCGL